MKFLVIITFLLVQLFVQAQTKTHPYAAIDNRVMKIQARTADSLALKLTSVYKTEKEKARAIFRWITENIAYDVEGYHRSALIYAGLWSPGVSTDVAVIEKDYNDKIVQKVLKERRAICDGYSRLFKTLCDNAGIKCNIITGYIRWSSDSIGLVTARRHAWNAVFIENSWRLIDATWASGYCNNEATIFTKSFDDFFYFTDPVQLFNDHFPDDKTWALLPVIPSLQQFYNFPFYYPDFYRAKISSVYPTAGIIEVSDRKRSIRLELGLTQPVKNFDIVEYPHAFDTAVVPLDTVVYNVEKGKITCDYRVLSENANRIDVLLNDRRILSYTLRIYRPD